MSDFIEIIPIGDKKYYFSFSKVIIPHGVKFSVTILENDDAIVFDMKSAKDGWKIVQPVPEWIKKTEDKLSEAIKIRVDLKI